MLHRNFYQLTGYNLPWGFIPMGMDNLTIFIPTVNLFIVHHFFACSCQYHQNFKLLWFYSFQSSEFLFSFWSFQKSCLKVPFEEIYKNVISAFRILINRTFKYKVSKNQGKHAKFSNPDTCNSKTFINCHILMVQVLLYWLQGDNCI